MRIGYLFPLVPLGGGVVPTNRTRRASRQTGNPRWRSCLVAFTLALVFGCGSKAELYPAHGKVFVAGAPAEGAIVVLHPTSETDPTTLRPSARVAADGSFALEAPPGEYKVAVTWFEDLTRTDRVTGTVTTKLPPRYGDPKTSPLRAEIGPHDNEIPTFQLTK
jgi:hypothetical protein